MILSGIKKTIVLLLKQSRFRDQSFGDNLAPEIELLKHISSFAHLIGIVGYEPVDP
jgi:hypothetical protein